MAQVSTMTMMDTGHPLRRSSNATIRETDTTLSRAREAYRHRLARLSEKPRQRDLKEYLDLCQLMAMLDETTDRRAMPKGERHPHHWSSVLRFRLHAARNSAKAFLSGVFDRP
ncbi:MAG: hypothetical protein AAF698_12345 [Pseudomonadota bacterium]